MTNKRFKSVHVFFFQASFGTSYSNKDALVSQLLWMEAQHQLKKKNYWQFNENEQINERCIHASCSIGYTWSIRRSHVYFAILLATICAIATTSWFRISRIRVVAVANCTSTLKTSFCGSGEIFIYLFQLLFQTTECLRSTTQFRAAQNIVALTISTAEHNAHLPPFGFRFCVVYWA